MECKIGKIYEFYPEQGYGNIITNEKKYIFYKKDVEHDGLKKGDVVIFSGETVNNKNRAFFVRNYTDKKVNKEVKTKQ